MTALEALEELMILARKEVRSRKRAKLLAEYEDLIFNELNRIADLSEIEDSYYRRIFGSAN